MKKIGIIIVLIALLPLAAVLYLAEVAVTSVQTIFVCVIWCAVMIFMKNNVYHARKWTKVE